MSEHEHQGSGSLNTLTLGILIGILLTLLLTTKKGKKLLKLITDEGVEKLGKWEDMLKSMEKEIVQEATSEEPVIGEDMEKEVRAIEPPKTEKIILDDREEEEPIQSEKAGEEKTEVPEKKSKRLFRGIRRKN